LGFGAYEMLLPFLYSGLKQKYKEAQVQAGTVKLPQSVL
jgi:hypothetical protein